MASYRSVLAQPRLTIVSGEPDFDLRHLASIIRHAVRVDGGAEFERLLGHLLADAGDADGGAAGGPPRTLDLIGHSRSPASLLTLGRWTIDATDPAVVAVFRRLADQAVLPRLGAGAVRLLGCKTAATPAGRATIGWLSEILGVEVYGATQLLDASHYDAGGFRDCWGFQLVGSSELRREAHAGGAAPVADRAPRVLDLAGLPAVMLDPASPVPRRIATVAAAEAVVGLLRCAEGAQLLGPSPPPCYELALPSARPGAYHLAHVLLDGEFLRVHPDGGAAPGIVYPVEDPGALRRILGTLPSAPAVTA